MASAIIVVLVLRTPMRGLFGARVAYALWLLPLIAVVASLLPPMTVSVAAGAIDFPVQTLASQISAPFSLAHGIAMALLSIWLTGASVAAVLMLRRQAAFLAGLGRLESQSATTPRHWVRAQGSGTGPAVVGVFRPVIVTPADFERRYGAEERAIIIAHESEHIRAGDARINALAVAAQCLCWFNPLVHLAARCLRVDQELACDAAVLRRLDVEPYRYGEVLLKTQLAGQHIPFGCSWPARARHALALRLRMLRAPLPRPARSAFGVAVIATLGLVSAREVWASRSVSDVSGTWSVVGRINDARNMVQAAPVCRFRQIGKRLDGVCEGPGSRGAATGTIVGERVAWRWDHDGYRPQGLKGESTFSGKLQGYSVITGAWSYSGLPGAMGTFTGRRQ
jgi:beta-lactamase regulating signal transducer with metallopeptidase domain